MNGPEPSDPDFGTMLAALADGRSLPVSRLADEAGLSPSTARSRLQTLSAAGVVSVEQHGRIRYYRLSQPADAATASIGSAPFGSAPFGSAPIRAMPIRSMQPGTQAHALRQARTCYDHVAGRLGVELMAVWLDRGLLTGGDGRFRPGQLDAPSSWGRDADYELTAAGTAFTTDFGIRSPSGRRFIRYCVDWTEERHHLAGALGRGLLDRLLALDWLTRAESGRALQVTATGRRGVHEAFGIAV